MARNLTLTQRQFLVSIVTDADEAGERRRGGVEWSIQQIARAAGTTTRTLRYYGEVGLLAPSRIGRNGYRFYNEDALVRLQRILLLRELGPASAIRSRRWAFTCSSSNRKRPGSSARSRPWRRPFAS